MARHKVNTAAKLFDPRQVAATAALSRITADTEGKTVLPVANRGNGHAPEPRVETVDHQR
jgi:hypothetical protein